MKKLTYLWDTQPLQLVIFAGLILRLIAAIFSKGFAMHDDHFLVIETSQSWIDGAYNDVWLPVNGNTQPSGHSFLYPGIHFILFYVLKLINITDPQTKMFIVRILHAFYSILTIYFTFKITEKISDRKNAAVASLLIAVLWFFPFVSVRNLVEVVCIPFLLWSVWLIIKNENLIRNIFISGLLAGIAFSFRYQTLIFSGSIFLALIFQKKWKNSLVFLSGLLIAISLTQLPTDIIIWKRAFAELTEYVKYNFTNANNYISLPWYHYVIVLIGLLIPPLSFFLLFGFFRRIKQNLIIFLPTLAFLVFHSLFPNKQERFIISIIPFIIILGVIGWNEFKNTSAFWNKHKVLYKNSLLFFWIINLLLLSFFTPMYSKQARVESMIYISKYKNINSIMLEGETKIPPRFYLKQWVNVCDYSVTNDFQYFEKSISTIIPEKQPRFVLFFGNKNIDERVYKVLKLMPKLKYETTIEPGFIDKVLFWLNPKNANQQIIIYRNI